MFTESEKRVIILIVIVLIIGTGVTLFYPSEIRNETTISPFPVDINNASREELILLPGIGEVYADRIIEYREGNNGFKNKQELMNIKGIGPKKFASITDKITIGGTDDN